jgi:hypothetical protein
LRRPGRRAGPAALPLRRPVGTPNPAFRFYASKFRRLAMIRKLKSGEYRLYSRKKDADGKRKNLGTFSSRDAAEKHEREVHYFKAH